MIKNQILNLENLIEDFAAKNSLLAKRATFQINLPNNFWLGYLAQLGTLALKFLAAIILRLAQWERNTPFLPFNHRGKMIRPQ